MARRLILAASLLFSSFGACAAEDLAWSFPSPEDYGAHLAELCKPESSSALFIATLRDRGLTKEQVASRLPQGTPDRLRLTHVVKENLDDLFAYPEANIVTYYAFRGQSCVREKAEGKAIVQFSSIASDALKCQREVGLGDRAKLAACVRVLLR